MVRRKRLIHNLYIINGNIQGEEKDSMTYIGAAGRSVIDYIITNRSGEEKIEKMKVIEGIASDHLMLKISLSTEIEREDEAEKEREITKQTSEEIQEYEDSLKKTGKPVKWKDLRSKVSNAIPKKKIAAKDRPEEKRWWDEECHVAKKELKEVKRNYREDKAMKCHT